MLTLFQIITLDNWNLLVRPVVEGPHPGMLFFFVRGRARCRERGRRSPWLQSRKVPLQPGSSPSLAKGDAYARRACVQKVASGLSFPAAR